MLSREELYRKRAKLLEEAASAERCGALLKDLRGIWSMIDRVDREIRECEEALPEDYEECGECGFDHAYEWAEALKEHTLLDREDE